MTNDVPDARQLATILLHTFRGHPTTIIAWRGFKIGKKNIRSRKGPANLDHFRWHVEQQKDAGIGLHPAYPVNNTGTLYTNWAMLDFDYDPPERLLEFMTWLREEWGVQPLFNRGSTGRGTHLWFLFEQNLPVEKVIAFLRAAHDEAKRRGLGKVEIRPTSATQKGSAVILPYRGAAGDGYGPQGLNDPETGEAISLVALPAFPRSGVKTLLAKLKSPSTPRRPQRRASTVINDPAAPPDDRWQAEVRRVEMEYEPGQRQHLVLGLSAYGLYLGLPAHVVESDVLGLCERQDDEELSMRRAAVEGTIGRFQAGQGVAVREFYLRAGVTPPDVGRDEEILARVQGLRAWMLTFAWTGPVGLSARSTYLTLLKLAEDCAHLHDQGLEVSVSWRALMERADLGSRNTLQRVLVYLEDHGLLERANPPVGEKSGSFLLRVTDATTLTMGLGSPFRKIDAPTFRAGKGRLGKKKEVIFDLLLAFPGLTRHDLASRLGRRPTDFREAVQALTAEGLIAEQDGHLHPAPDWPARLADREQRDRSDRAREQQKNLHQAERDLYHLKLAKGQGRPSRPPQRPQDETAAD